MRKHTETLVEEVDAAVEELTRETDKLVRPYRRSVFRRFPTLFMILVTFGVAATFFGFERIIAETNWLGERPWYILGVGLLTLLLTGRLYKKLG
jgi:hypothetical protein